MLRIALALAVSSLAAAPVAAASVGDLAIKSSVKGDGPTIIFVHGWTCDESVWDDQVAHFSKDYRVVTLDLPGHGQTDSPAQAEFSIDLFADAVEAVRAEMGAEKVVIVGHSMGVAVARQYALAHPEHVAGVVGVDGPLDMRVIGEIPPFGDLSLDQRRSFIESMFVPATSPELRAEILDLMLSAPAETAHGAMRALFDPALQTDEQITSPALSINAETSNFAASEAMREILPDWDHATIAETGHFLMMERPAVFDAVLENFLETGVQF